MPAYAPVPDAFPVVLQANAVQFAPGESFGFSRVESRMVVGCRAGEGEAQVDGVRHRLDSGKLLALPWGHRISYEAAESDPFLLIGAHLVPCHGVDEPLELVIPHEPHHRHAGSPARADEPALGVDHTVATSAAERPVLAHLLSTVVEVFERSTPDLDTVRALGRLLYDELSELAHPVGSDVPTDVPEPLRRALMYADQHLDAHLTVANLANVCGISQPTLTRWFRIHLGQTPMHWLAERRLGRAMLLLRSTALSVSQIADRCGFNDPYYFSRVFRTRTGQPPTEWRRQQRLL